MVGEKKIITPIFAKPNPIYTPMKKIRYLNFRMDFPVRPFELSQFRGAMLNGMEDAPDLFHKHSETGVIYRYPNKSIKLSERNIRLCAIEN